MPDLEEARHIGTVRVGKQLVGCVKLCSETALSLGKGGDEFDDFPRRMF